MKKRFIVGEEKVFYVSNHPKRLASALIFNILRCDGSADALPDAHLGAGVVPHAFPWILARAE
jgi:hypothetical protein